MDWLKNTLKTLNTFFLSMLLLCPAQYVFAQDEDYDDDELNDALSETQSAFDESMSSTDLASATPTSFDQTEIKNSVTSVGNALSYITAIGAGATGANMLLKCPQIYTVGYGSAATFAITGTAHFVSEVINNVRLGDTLKNRISAYQNKVEAYQGMDNSFQIESVKEAKAAHEEIKAGLDWKQAINAVATTGYGVAAILATVEAVSENASIVLAGSGLVLKAKNTTTMATCSGAVNLVHVSPRKQDFEIYKIAAVIDNKDSSDDLSSKIFRIQEFYRFLNQQVQSQSLDDFEKTKEIISKLDITIDIPQNFITSMASMIFPVAMAQDSLEEGSSKSAGAAALDVGMQALAFGGATFAIMKTFPKINVPIMIESNPRAVLYWVFFGMGVGANVFIATERSRVQKRIDEYDVILAELEKMSSSSSDTTSDGSGEELTDRLTGESQNQIQTQVSLGCVSGAWSADPACNCSASNNCAGADLAVGDPQKWSFSMPSWGMKSLDASQGMAKAVGSNNWGQASSLGDSAGKLAINLNRAQKVAEDQLLKASEGQFVLGAERGKMEAHLKAEILKSNPQIESSLTSSFGDILAESETPGQGVSNAQSFLASVEKNIKKKNKKTKSVPGWDLGLDLNSKDDRAPASQTEELGLEAYKVNTREIHRDDVNIFDVLSSRYVRTYDRLFKHKSLSTGSPE